MLDRGFIRLDACAADDLSVVNAARVSFGRRQDVLDTAGKGLIGFLMRERHGTPFEHNFMRWHVRCPIFVAREWFRHRIASYNEQSQRYATAKAEFYVPAAEDVRTQVGKPGAYRHDTCSAEVAEQARAVIEAQGTAAFAAYDALLKAGVAKELARTVLPVGTYTEFYFTCNARSLMNFLSLRNAPTALHEIRAFAQAIEHVWAQAMPVTHAAFVAAGRKPP